MYFRKKFKDEVLIRSLSDGQRKYILQNRDSLMRSWHKPLSEKPGFLLMLMGIGRDGKPKSATTLLQKPVTFPSVDLPDSWDEFQKVLADPSSTEAENNAARENLFKKTLEDSGIWLRRIRDGYQYPTIHIPLRAPVRRKTEAQKELEERR